MATVYEEDIHVSDYGTRFTITVKEDGVPVDISTATEKKLTFKPPSGSNIVKDMSFDSDGVDGKVVYVVETGVFSVAGKWKYQLKIKMPSGQWYSTTKIFYVSSNL